MATLVYLAVQVRGNTRALRTASRQEIVHTFRAVNDKLLDAENARVFSEGLTIYPNQPFEDCSRFNTLMNDLALFFQNVFALYESGQLEEETYRAYREWVATVFATPGGTAWWEGARPFYTRPMVGALDERLGAGDFTDPRELDGYRLDRALRLDHIVLCVADVQKTVAFYESVLGMQARQERPGKWSLHFGLQKLSLQPVGGEPEMARDTVPGSGNFCLLSAEPVDRVADALRRKGIEIVAGPDERDGATGKLASVYFRDPDGNLVEVSNPLPA